jgi:hypothetical protein
MRSVLSDSVLLRHLIPWVLHALTPFAGSPLLVAATGLTQALSELTRRLDSLNGWLHPSGVPEPKMRSVQWETPHPYPKLTRLSKTVCAASTKCLVCR